MRSRADIKAHSWNTFKQFYWPTAGAYCVFMVISFACGLFPLLTLLVANIVLVGSMGYFLCRYRWHQANVGILFIPFHRYGRVLGGTLWKTLWIFLWTLLFIVPGIVKMYSYFCTEFILADSPKVEAMRALELSKRMMPGNKAKVFVMHLSFLGWIFLGAAGIFIVSFLSAFNGVVPVPTYDMNFMNPFSMYSLMGGWYVVATLAYYAYFILFVGPYISITSAGFYDEIKRDAIMRGVVREEEFNMSEAELQAYYYNWQQQYAYQQQQAQGQQPYGQQPPPSPYSAQQPPQSPYEPPKEEE